MLTRDKITTYIKNRNIIFLAIIVGIVAFLIFIPNLNDGFLSDDYDFLSRMDSITDFSTGYQQLNPTGHGFWRPLINGSFILNYLIFGESSAFTYHLFNNILHAIISLLLVLITHKLFKNKIISVTAGLFFALYPMHHESVTWIAGRTDVLAAFFFIASLFFALSYLEKKKLKFHISALLLFVCSLLSKEMGLTLPVLLFIINVIWFKEQKKINYLKTYIPYLIIWLLYFIGRYSSIGFLIGGYMTFDKTTHLNLPFLAILVSPTYYFTKIINFNFLADYPSLFVQSLSALVFAYKKILLLFGLLTIWVLQIKKLTKRNYLEIFGLYLLIVLSAAPAWSMLVNIQPNGIDTRLLYFSTIFGSILLAYLLCKIANKYTKFTVIIFVLVFFSFSNYINYLPWQNANEIKDNIITELKSKKLQILYDEFVYVANLPDNHFGAYIFRNGFEENVENDFGDEAIFINGNNKKVWRLESNGVISHMCKTATKKATNFYFLDNTTGSLVDRSELLQNEVSNNTEYTIEKNENYNIISWKNKIWEGTPNYFTIKYPPTEKPDDFLSSCPLWQISNKL